MNLPYELIDETLSFLPSDDRQSFKNCSLVSRSWVNPSRRCHFETVHIRATTLRAWRTNIPPADDKDLQQLELALESWLESIPPANSGLSEYVRWLLLLWWVLFPLRGRVRDRLPQRPRDGLLQLVRGQLQWLRDIIPPAENGPLHQVRSLLQSLRNTIPPEDVELLHHVRSWSYIADTRDNCGGWYFIHVFRSYSPSLHQLRHLSLSSVCLPLSIPQEVGIFSAFQHTLSRLSLTSCDFVVDTLISFINYFLNLNRLDLTRPLPVVDVKPVRPLSRPLLGQLHISEAYEGRFCILNRLSGVGLSFDEIVLDGSSPVSLHTLGRVVEAVGVRVKCLRLSEPLERCAYITESYVGVSEPETRPCGGRTYNSLSLPGASGIGDTCGESRGRGNRSPFFHRVQEDPKGDVRTRTLIPKILGLGKS